MIQNTQGILTRGSRLICVFGCMLLSLVVLTDCNLARNSDMGRGAGVTGLDVGCKDDLKQNLKDYFAGNLSQDSSGGMIDCTLHDLSEFTKYVQGAKQDEYTFDEVANFFAKYYGDTKEFQPQYLRVYFKIKALMMGGTDTVLRRADIANITNFLKDARPTLAELSQYMNIVFFRESLRLNQPSDVARFEKLNSLIDDLKTHLNKNLTGNKGYRFRFDDLSQLNFTQLASNASLGDSEGIQLLRSLKAIMVSPPEDQLEGENWQPFIEQAAATLKVILRFNYAFDLNSFSGNDFYSQMAQIADGARKLTTNAFNYQPQPSIPVNELNTLINRLGKYNMTPYKVSAPSLLHVLPTLLYKVLLIPPQSVPHDGLRQAQLDTLFSSLDEWLYLQSQFLKMLDGKQQIVASDLMAKIDQSIVAQNQATPHLNALKTTQGIFSQGVFLRWLNSRQLNLQPRSLDQSFAERDLFYYSTVFTLMRGLIRGFVTEADRRAEVSKIKVAELIDLYDAYEEVGTDLKFIDPRNPGSPARTFIEANVFTSVSNGDDWVDLHEAMEWLYQALSAGKTSDYIYDNAPKECYTSEIDIFGHYKVEHDCFARYFETHAPEFFSQLPVVSSFLNKALVQGQATSSDENWTSYLSALENAYRNYGQTNDDYDSSELASLSLIVQYDEAIFRNFDTKRAGVLDNDEIWNAFPLVKTLIVSASNGAANNTFLQKGAFSYLIKFGALPDTSSTVGKAKFLAWSAGEGIFHESAEPTDIMRVIASFNQMSRNNKMAALDAFYDTNKAMLPAKLKAGDPAMIEQLRVLLSCDTDALASLTTTFQAKTLTWLSTTKKPKDSDFRAELESEIKADPFLDQVCARFQ